MLTSNSLILDWNIGRILKSDVSDSKVYSFLFETTLMVSDGEGNLNQEKLVQGNITTDPTLTDRSNPKTLAFNGKLKYFLDGSIYCDDKISQSGCSYDARLMIENGRLQVR